MQGGAFWKMCAPSLKAFKINQDSRPFCENRNTIKNTEALSQPSREFGLEVNTEKPKDMVVSRPQNVGQNQSLLTANICFEIMAKSN
jgi:hypothetical protein